MLRDERSALKIRLVALYEDSPWPAKLLAVLLSSPCNKEKRPGLELGLHGADEAVTGKYG